MPEKYWASCPNCGTDINYSSFTYDDYDENVVYFIGRGQCLHCTKRWEWEEKFVLSEIRFFKEITENTDY